MIYKISLPNGEYTDVEFSMPDLVGTEKQISYALHLISSHETVQKIIAMRARAEFIQALPELQRAKWTARGWGAENCASEIAGANAALGQTNAGFWIDNFDAITAVRKPYI